MADAIALLKQDHQKVKELFQAFEQQPERSDQEKVVNMALKELEVHAALEEEIFYPAVREGIHEDELMNEAAEEHLVAKRLIQELKRMGSRDARYEAKFKVLRDVVKHHIEEEEAEMLPKAAHSDLDFEELAESMLQRKQALMHAKEPTQRRLPQRATTRRRAAPRHGRVLARSRRT